MKENIVGFNAIHTVYGDAGFRWKCVILIMICLLNINAKNVTRDSF